MIEDAGMVWQSCFVIGQEARQVMCLPVGPPRDIDTPSPLLDLPAAIREVLEEPVGSPPLYELVGPKTRIAPVMDDAGRPTPVRRLSPEVLAYLAHFQPSPNTTTADSHFEPSGRPLGCSFQH